MPAQHQSSGPRNAIRSQSGNTTKSATAYHWDRIIIIGAIALLGVVLVGLLVAKYLDREAKIAPVSPPNFLEEVQPPSAGSQQVDPLPITKSVETETPVESPSPDIVKESTTAAEDDVGTLIDLEPRLNTEVSRPMEASSKKIELPNTMASAETAEALPIVETSLTLDKESPVKTNANDDLLDKEETQTPVENIEEAVAEDENVPMEDVRVKNQPTPETVAIAETENTGLKTEILSEHIGRIQLAWNVENYEPVDPIDSSINLNGRDLVKVHLFTVLRNLIDTTVYHDWYNNDQRVARVEIKPFLTPMRATSIKKVSPYMLGKWRTEVVTEQGEVLARVFFEVN
ncbi:DUF2914 domain-containing protein [Hahella ganghwensis]|uniref:DUF2914 domain-containing protein n=1 Tax=Hahella ganghwensis TaxID=286420 RepID=UPI000381F475|nr:DUF2914 domain-containing protein [Hahella ganghwensis]